MIKEKNEEYRIDEEEIVRAFMKFRNYPAEEQAYAIAFINGMNFQKSVSEAGRPVDGIRSCFAICNI